RWHHGAVVKALTINELVEMFQVMAELEGLCARLAARRMTADRRKEMRRMHELCAERAAAGDHDGFFEANNRFHEVIYVASHNRFLEKETRALRNRVNPYRHFITYQPGRMDNSIDEHEAVTTAIEAHDGEAAHRLMREHVNLLAESAADVIAVLRLGDSPLADEQRDVGS
ncbi:MAG: GntR family transcriptional regulator, partial [Geminicoccales bacterium]